MIFPRSPKPAGSIILIEPCEEKTLSSHTVTLSGFGESTMSIPMLFFGWKVILFQSNLPQGKYISSQK